MLVESFLDVGPMKPPVYKLIDSSLDARDPFTAAGRRSLRQHQFQMSFGVQQATCMSNSTSLPLEAETSWP
jgi:hypothetical protein